MQGSDGQGPERISTFDETDLKSFMFRSQSTNRHGRESLSVVHARNGDLIDGSVLAHDDCGQEVTLAEDRDRCKRSSAKVLKEWTRTM